MYYNKEMIRDKLAMMKRGEGYFDFGKVGVFFDSNGYFNVVRKNYSKIVGETKSLQEAVKIVKMILD